MANSISIVTDTATACLFDLSCLQHRKSDVGDWWSFPENEIDEVNKGNMLVLHLGSDGTYRLKIVDEQIPGRQFCLKIPSGEVYIGPSEEITGGGFEPDGRWGGQFLSVAAGQYVLTIAKTRDLVELHFEPGGDGTNHLTDPIRL